MQEASDARSLGDMGQGLKDGLPRKYPQEMEGGVAPKLEGRSLPTRGQEPMGAAEPHPGAQA